MRVKDRYPNMFFLVGDHIHCNTAENQILAMCEDGDVPVTLDPDTPIVDVTDVICGNVTVH